MQKSRTAVLRGNRSQPAAEAMIIRLGIVCCACAIIVVLAVAITAAL